MEIPTDARVIVSTNRNLEEEVRKGRFRHDLFYRLNVIPIRVPPLRHRPEDISLLAYHFLQKYSKEFGKDVRRLAPRVVEAFLAYPWPGNVRELENTIERAVALCDGEEVEAVGILPVQGPGSAGGAPGPDPSVPQPEARAPRPYAEAREAFERSYLAELLEAAKGNVTEASRIAGIARQNLYAKIKKLGMGDRPIDR